MHGCLLGVIQCGDSVIWFRDGGGGSVQGRKSCVTIPPPLLQNLRRLPLLSSSFFSFSVNLHPHHPHLLFQEAGLASQLTCPQASG